MPRARIGTLDSADLTDADLAHADLTRADLTRADLSSATITGANLTGAVWLKSSPLHRDGPVILARALLRPAGRSSRKWLEHVLARTRREGIRVADVGYATASTWVYQPVAASRPTAGSRLLLTIPGLPAEVSPGQMALRSKPRPHGWALRPGR